LVPPTQAVWQRAMLVLLHPWDPQDCMHIDAYCEAGEFGQPAGQSACVAITNVHSELPLERT
jgi:hypothetical protein